MLKSCSPLRCVLRCCELIDIHTHMKSAAIGILTYMDYFNVDAAVVLASRARASLTPDIPASPIPYQPPTALIEACSKYPNRLIPFCNVDLTKPNIAERIEESVRLGGKGYGEHKVKLRVDAHQAKEIYRTCGELDIPVLVHLGYEANEWNLDVDGFDRAASEFPKTSFIAHGEGWWRQISREVPPVAYPMGKVKLGGKVDRILQNHSNVYADLSAWSGSNALSRDLEFAKEFVERHKDRLLFGTDFYERRFAAPLLIYTPFKAMDDLELSEKTYRAITHENASKLLKL